MLPQTQVWSASWTRTLKNFWASYIFRENPGLRFASYVLNDSTKKWYVSIVSIRARYFQTTRFKLPIFRLCSTEEKRFDRVRPKSFFDQKKTFRCVCIGFTYAMTSCSCNGKFCCQHGIYIESPSAVPWTRIDYNRFLLSNLLPS